MTTYLDVPSETLVESVANNLKELEALQPPEWAPYVKTAAHRERSPVQPDWWFLRSAALLRKIALRGPIGTQRLARLYSGPRDRGSKPNRSVTGSRSIIRKSLQQLEQAELIETLMENKVCRGRMITPKGQALLDNCAYQMTQQQGSAIEN